MPDENTVDDIFDSPDVVLVVADQLERQVAERVRSLDLGPGAVVFVADRPRDRAAVASIVAGAAITSPPPSGRVLARWSPMTDAIKRVDGHRVVETVDREQLRVIDWPMAVPTDLARRWAAAVLDPRSDQSVDQSEGRRFTAAALLSELVALEPELVVGTLDLDT